ncbi:unnamed protein product [Calicophoron daubneyi]|uniref:Uncharacterized protein n=1 Tax=Calicophoron daubneyi TaxID=300641 RepID=A0AAV2TL28_CALDB
MDDTSVIAPNGTEVYGQDLNITSTASALATGVTGLVNYLSTATTKRTSKYVAEFACVKAELTEPDFPRYACSGSKITSWIASTFLMSMIVFGVVKCLVTHGVRNIFDLRLTGVSFPQRPEFFVLLCSSLPLVFSVLSRPLFTPLSLHHDIFIRGWGLAQTRFFFDLFTRGASIYHLVYWAYRTPIIHLLWRIKVVTMHYYKLWQDRPKPQRKLSEVKKPLSTTSPRTYKAPPQRHGRTGDYGYGKKKARTRSVRETPKSSTAGSVASTEKEDGGQNNPQAAQVINAGGVSLIAPQPLFTNQMNNMAQYGPGGSWQNTGMAQFGQGMMNFPNNFNMYNQMSAGMDYGMNFNMATNMGMNQAGMMAQNYGQPGMFFSMGGNMPMTPGLTSSSTETPTLPDGSAKNATVAKPVKQPIVIPPPTRKFCLMCKRIIPSAIYVMAFLVTLPSIFAFEIDDEEFTFVAARCTQRCRSYFYYDLVVLVSLPTIMMIVAFYHGALCKKQLNGGTKMRYRLRCYYVTFILLNIPMFVLMLTSIGFRLTEKPYRNIYGTGILIAMTAYHANFALKSTVYTTGCNCICCTDGCLARCPLIVRFLDFFTTPVAVKDKAKQMESTVISVTPSKKR